MANPLHNVGKGSWNKVTNHLSSLPKDAAIGFGIGAAFETMSSLNEGKGFGESLTRGFAMGVVENVIGAGALTALQIAPALPGMVRGYQNYEDKLNSQYISRRDPRNMNFSYTDTQAAYTMREAAVQAIQGSKLNARSALGGEARLMHRGIPR